MQQKAVSAGKELPLADDRYCFACGADNHIGLHLAFSDAADGRLRCSFLPKKQHQGYAGIVHGGIIGLILDELMVQALWRTARPAVTAQFEMRFRQAAQVGEALDFLAWVEKEERGVFYMRAECRSAGNGQTIAAASAKCRRANGLRVNPLRPSTPAQFDV
ncbi:MAG: PaaI family thioesterase [Candidatus Omnitrophica bacterium]|nr:PaaI family thioesterase [Candidatus Omnitrophota bacterium]